MSNKAFFGEDGFAHNAFVGSEMRESVDGPVAASNAVMIDLKSCRRAFILGDARKWLTEK